MFGLRLFDGAGNGGLGIRLGRIAIVFFLRIGFLVAVICAFTALSAGVVANTVAKASKARTYRIVSQPLPGHPPYRNPRSAKSSSSSPAPSSSCRGELP